MGEDQENANALDYIKLLFEPDDVIEFRLIANNRSQRHKPRSIWARAGQVNGELNEMKEWNNNGFNIYIGANPRCDFKKKGDKNIHLARSVFVDFDNYNENCEELARVRIDDAGLPEPTMTVNSGHGIHCYWKLVEPINDMEHWKWFQDSLISTLHTDKKIKNPERIMRLPGYLNAKEKPYVAAEIVKVNRGSIYRTQELEAVLRQSRPTEKLLDESVLSDIATELSPEMLLTVPVEKDTRRDCLFTFARQLKSTYKVKNGKLFFPLLDQWLGKAMPNINHNDKGFNRTQFVAAYNDVKYLIGDSPMARMYEESKTVNLPSKWLLELKMYETPKLIILAKFCWVLQEENPNKPFFLKQKAVAQLMEVSQQYISDLLKDLLAEQFLVVISEYKRPIDKKKGKTKSYKVCI